jgi:hypothetical protein
VGRQAGTDAAGDLPHERLVGGEVNAPLTGITGVVRLVHLSSITTGSARVKL